MFGSRTFHCHVHHEAPSTAVPGRVVAHSKSSGQISDVGCRQQDNAACVGVMGGCPS